MCGVPAASIGSPRPQGVEQVVRGIEQAGRRPVLLAGTPGAARAVRRPARMIMNLHTTQDENSLTAPPTHTLPLDVPVWMTEPAR